MKKILPLLLIMLTTTAFAKKVKFAVDMGTDSVSILGAHIQGDFQIASGLAADWDPGATLLTQEGTTNIYSVVVDIPAFKKYEYSFVNGIQGYEVESIPLESQVQYNFLINRFIYIDSTANDTTDIGAVRFSGNAPAGKQLLRFKVDMQLQTVANDGVYVGTSFYNGAYKTFRMCPLGKVFHYITYVDSGATTFTYEFKNGISNAEIKDTTCANATNLRSINFATHKELDTVCYTKCVQCFKKIPAAITNVETYLQNNILYANHQAILQIANPNCTIIVCDAMGNIIAKHSHIYQSTFVLPSINTTQLLFVKLFDEKLNWIQTLKYIQQ
jgi:hypothetical protein